MPKSKSRAATPPAKPTKRAHRPNPDHPRRVYTFEQRLAIVAAVCISCWVAYTDQQDGSSSDTSAGEVDAASGLPITIDGKLPLAESVVNNAVRLLRTMVLVHGVPLAAGWWDESHAHQTVRNWWCHLLTYEDLGDVHHETLAPHHLITDDMLDTCIHDIKTHLYTSMDACMHMSPLVQKVCADAQCSVQYLWHRMQRREPELVYSLVLEPRMKLTPELKEQRVAYCKEMLTLLASGVLQYYCWMDQKKMWIKPASKLYAWHVRGPGGCEHAHPSVVESELMGPEFKGWCTYVYVVVNALLGPVLIAKCTGTKEGAKKKSKKAKKKKSKKGKKKAKEKPEPDPQLLQPMAPRPSDERVWMTQSNHVAKNPPAAEIVHLLDMALSKVNQAKEQGLWPEGQPPVWSLDNVSVHKSAKRQWERKTGTAKGSISMPPAYSPDLHQVVEHSIATMSRAFKDKLLGNTLDVFNGLPCARLDSAAAGAQAGRVTIQHFYELQADIFYKTITKEAIQANLEKLKRVYDKVIELGGEYPEASFR